ncbi:MAG: hypothetical protein JSU96_17180 [Acidobacteriota bacterium]|nr:MAG: hypothetical protein JSU96_17180 [Acidobacteriota bacterium]
MRKAVVLSIITLLVLLTIPGLAAGDSYRVSFTKKALVAGVEIEPGKYKLVLNGDNFAEIYDGKELLVKAEVQVEELGPRIPNSVSQSPDGTVHEIRLKKERVVFATS